MNKDSLKEYLSSRYQGCSSFLSNVIFPIFGEEDFEEGYEAELLDSHPERKQLAVATGIRSIKQVGMMYIGVEPLQIFDVTVSDHVMMERNRVNIQRLIRSVMDHFSCAFMLFHYDDAPRWDWRFTFCRKSGNKEETTDSKRYTFLLGPGQSCRTATDNFMALYEKRDSLEIKDIENAFNVEALSKEFFGKYKEQYEKFVEFITGKRFVKHGDKYVETITHDPHPEIYQEFDCDDKRVRDYVKKLLGRIVFLHFLQKKGWLGVPAGKDWGEGDRDFMLRLFLNASTHQKDNFLDDILEPLFSDGLDHDRSGKGDIFDTKVEGYHNCRIPYLNGGLFERDSDDQKACRFPASYFESLLTMLSQYNFTIDENDPNDAEVGVDPEMLGRIFENLLEDNKDKGAYYTPKEIVQYMCRESLIAYLQTDQREEDKERIRQFVTTHDAEVLGSLRSDIDQKLIDVKICDPAIGSGAFPMGLLRELFFCRSAIEPNIAENAANIKRHIIQNNIYGVDIERGAVDIARLRFWLSLIVDEKSPEVLPNLDYKIMRGNSLLTTFNDRHINLDTKGQKHIKVNEMNEEKKKLYKLKQLYYNATGVNKLQLDVDIKKSILRLIAHQLGYESRSWLQKKDTQGNLFPQQMPFEEVKQQLPPDQLKSINECEDLYKKLCNQNIPLAERAQIDIRFFDWRMMFTEVFDTSLSRPSKGGFDIVIGNPPYGAKYDDETKLYYKRNYLTAKSIKGIQKASLDTYTLFIELGYNLLCKHGSFAYIVPISLTSSDSLTGVHRILMENCDTIHISSYAVRPKPVFENAVVNTSILLFQKTETPCQHLYSTKMHRKGNRFDLQRLIENLQFVDVIGQTLYGRIPKIGSEIEKRILMKLFNQKKLGSIMKNSGSPVVYRFAGGRYFKVVTNYRNGSSAERTIYFDSKHLADAIGCILSSNLSFWFYQIFSDNLNWKNYEIENFTIPQLSMENIVFLNQLYSRYLADIEANANTRKTSGESTYNVDSFKEYKIVRSKSIIDEIDDYICPLYGLTPEETEYIKNYELEFRLAGD